METTIYFVRHAITQMNVEKIYHGDRDVPLCREGFEQLEYLAREFAGEPLTAVYSSPLERAVLSARAIAEPHALPVQILPELNERAVGPFEGRRIEDMYRDPLARPLLMSTVPLHPPAGVEEPAAVQARYRRAARQMLAENPGGVIAAAVHGFALQMYLAYILNIPLERYSRLKMRNASVARVDYAPDGTASLRYVDRCDFLPERLLTENIAAVIDDEEEQSVSFADWKPAR